MTAPDLPTAQPRPQFLIFHQKGWADCECCGSYDWAAAQVYLCAPGVDARTLASNLSDSNFLKTEGLVKDGSLQLVLHAGYDGHFGGGNWDGSAVVLRYWLLQWLGYRVEINGQPANWLPYRDLGATTLDAVPTQPASSQLAASEPRVRLWELSLSTFQSFTQEQLQWAGVDEPFALVLESSSPNEEEAERNSLLSSGGLAGSWSSRAWSHEHPQGASLEEGIHVPSWADLEAWGEAMPGSFDKALDAVLEGCCDVFWIDEADAVEEW